MQQQTELIKKVRASLAEKKGYKRRKVIDFITRNGIKTGGVGVVLAVVLILFYLLSVVMPLFKGAELIPSGDSHTVTVLANGQSQQEKSHVIYFASDEYGEVVTLVEDTGQINFLDEQGVLIHSTQLQIAPGELISSVTPIEGRSGWLALAISSGQVFIVSQKYQLTYPQGKRKTIPSIEYPIGDDGESVEIADSAMKHLSVFISDDTLLVAYENSQGSLKLKSFTLEESLLSETLSIEEGSTYNIPYSLKASGIMLANDGRWLYITSESGQVALYQIVDDKIEVVATGNVSGNAQIISIAPLLGDYSILVGDSSGAISQWFGFRDKEYHKLQLAQVRSFKLSSNAITRIIPEKQRKGFLAFDTENNLGVFYTTSEKTLLIEKLAAQKDEIKIPFSGKLFAALNSSSSRLILYSDTRIQKFHLINEHPEVSMSALWSKVWYESYSEPEYVWQSSASNNDFEAKFSLAPLTYGTLKAAFYALIFAIPLALFGAIYTAYFMSPKLRSVVKPTIEIMEALPTVILGFLAGLWLAPFIEIHLTGVMLFLLLTPLLTLVAGFAYQKLPKSIRQKIPEGWRPVLLIPVIALIAYLTTHLSVPIEDWLFDGNARIWLRDEMGFTFDQRNALVVGIAMGFTVIPTIFSIAEDSLFSVPKHLVAGSLALGANPWQTLVKVVLPTASPGIFSAVMIGMGRAVGETMIVLMATGNTPIMNMNIFEGMRTLAANIAVEMPEAEVASSHYRILYLAALVLFAFTFVANTIAEMIRHRLRKKYSSL